MLAEDVDTFLSPFALLEVLPRSTGRYGDTSPASTRTVASRPPAPRPILQRRTNEDDVVRKRELFEDADSPANYPDPIT